MRFYQNTSKIENANIYKTIWFFLSSSEFCAIGHWTYTCNVKGESINQITSQGQATLAQCNNNQKEGKQFDIDHTWGVQQDNRNNSKMTTIIGTWGWKTIATTQAWCNVSKSSKTMQQ